MRGGLHCGLYFLDLRSGAHLGAYYNKVGGLKLSLDEVHRVILLPSRLWSGGSHSGSCMICRKLLYANWMGYSNAVDFIRPCLYWWESEWRMPDEGWSVLFNVSGLWGPLVTRGAYRWQQSGWIKIESVEKIVAWRIENKVRRRCSRMEPLHLYGSVTRATDSNHYFHSAFQLFKWWQINLAPR